MRRELQRRVTSRASYSRQEFDFLNYPSGRHLTETPKRDSRKTKYRQYRIGTEVLRLVGPRLAPFLQNCLYGLKQIVDLAGLPATRCVSLLVSKFRRFIGNVCIEIEQSNTLSC